jgi:hypothetical protein
MTPKFKTLLVVTDHGNTELKARNEGGGFTIEVKEFAGATDLTIREYDEHGFLVEDGETSFPVSTNETITIKP